MDSQSVITTCTEQTVVVLCYNIFTLGVVSDNQQIDHTSARVRRRARTIKHGNMRDQQAREKSRPQQLNYYLLLLIILLWRQPRPCSNIRPSYMYVCKKHRENTTTWPSSEVVLAGAMILQRQFPGPLLHCIIYSLRRYTTSSRVRVYDYWRWGRHHRSRVIFRRMPFALISCFMSPQKNDDDAFFLCMTWLAPLREHQVFSSSGVEVVLWRYVYTNNNIMMMMIDHVCRARVSHFFFLLTTYYNNWQFNCCCCCCFFVLSDIIPTGLL